MDCAVTAVSIAESARRAAEHAAVTLEHMPNPWPKDAPEHAKWDAAYARAFREAIAQEGGEGSA